MARVHSSRRKLSLPAFLLLFFLGVLRVQPGATEYRRLPKLPIMLSSRGSDGALRFFLLKLACLLSNRSCLLAPSAFPDGEIFDIFCGLRQQETNVICLNTNTHLSYVCTSSYKSLKTLLAWRLRGGESVAQKSWRHIKLTAANADRRLDSPSASACGCGGNKTENFRTRAKVPTANLPFQPRAST